MWVNADDINDQSAGWPRLGDEHFQQKEDEFKVMCDRLISDIGTSRLPAEKLTIQDAQLFSLLDTYTQFTIMADKGLIRISQKHMGLYIQSTNTNTNTKMNTNNI